MDNRRNISDEEWEEFKAKLKLAEEAHLLIPQFDSVTTKFTHQQAKDLVFYFTDNAYVNKLNKLHRALIIGMEINQKSHFHEIPLEAGI